MRRRSPSVTSTSFSEPSSSTTQTRPAHRRGLRGVGHQREVLRPHPQHGFAPVRASRCAARQRQREIGRCERRLIAAAERARDEVHGRAADEAGDEQVGGPAVDLRRRAELLHDAAVHDRDHVRHGHGFELVVRHVDRGGAEIEMEAPQLGAHGDAQLGVQIRQRLVHQEDVGLAHHGAAQRHALALPAGELPGLAVEQVADLQDAGDALARPRPSRPWASCARAGRSRGCAAPSSADRARRTGTPWRCCGRAGARSLTTRSPKRMSPAVTGSSPAIMRSSVVLPQPDGPSSVTNFRLGKTRSMSLSTCTAPKLLLMRSSFTSIAVRLPLVVSP